MLHPARRGAVQGSGRPLVLPRPQSLTCAHTSSRSIVELMLHRRLAATLLVMALLGANTGAASVCEAYCAGTGKNNAGHHHQTETRPSPPGHQTHAHHPNANCSECLKSAGRSSLQGQECGNFALAQTLQETARASSTDRKVSQLDINRTPANSLLGPIENARSSPLHSPPRISSFERILVSLRI